MRLRGRVPATDTTWRRSTEGPCVHIGGGNASPTPLTRRSRTARIDTVALRRPVADPASAIARPYRSAARRPFLRPGAGKASYPLGRSVAGPGNTVGPSLTRAYPLGVGSSLSPT